MGWLDRLKNETTPDTQATKPTKPPQGDEKVGFVGFVAYPPAPLQKIEGAEPAKDHAPALDAVQDFDRWNWPNSPAMNRVEVDTFVGRLARFTDRGLIVPVAEALADKLVIRDREADDRRVCLECAHLQGFTFHCGNWRRAEVARDRLAGELVLMLQRCAGFNEVAP